MPQQSVNSSQTVRPAADGTRALTPNIRADDAKAHAGQRRPTTHTTAGVIARRAQPGRSHAAPASPSRWERGAPADRVPAVGARRSPDRRFPASAAIKAGRRMGAPAPGVRAHSWPWGRRLTLLRGAPGPATSDCSPQWRPPGAGARILHRPSPEPRPVRAWGACAATTLGPGGNMLDSLGGLADPTGTFMSHTR
jgi:hypothetical protein